MSNFRPPQVCNFHPALTSVDVELTFLDADGRNAILAKKYLIRPNFAHSREIIHRNNAADGAIVEFKWNGVPVPPADVVESMGEYEITI